MHSDLSAELLAAVKCYDVTQLRSVIERAKITGSGLSSILGHGLCVAAEIGATDIIKVLTVVTTHKNTEVNVNITRHMICRRQATGRWWHLSWFPLKNMTLHWHKIWTYD